MHYFHRVLTICILLPLAILPASGQAEAPEGDAAALSPDQSVYHYRMKGKVRLLFFWVGKDDVGGGYIALTRTPNSGGGHREEIEVLFGSNPERVPGGVNRWGYGKETGYWESPAPTRPVTLTSSVFEGFIKHSKEESLDEVRANEAARQGNVFWYDGIRSRVLGSRAVSEIRTFPAQGDFDYRDASPVHCSYQERLAQGGPPDKYKQLGNDKHYQRPYGFLTGVKHLIQRVLQQSAQRDRWRGFRPWIPYVYNARLYRLRVDKVNVDSKFQLPLADGSKETFHNVAKIQFTLRKEATGEDHEFNLWVPLEGRYRGIPIRIVDKPRWWLRVELNLDPSRSAQTRSNMTLAGVKCENTSKGSD